MLGVEPRHTLLGSQDFFGMDEHVRRLPLETARRLVDKDAGVGQGGTLAGFACHQQERPH